MMTTRRFILFCTIWLQISSVCRAQERSLGEVNDVAAGLIARGKFDEALSVLQKAMTSSGNQEQLARSYNLLGELYETSGLNDSALVNYTKAYHLTKLSASRSTAATGIANTLTIDGKYDSARHFIGISMQYDRSERSRILNEIALGRLWQSQNVVDSSLHHWQVANDRAKALGDKRLQAIVLSGLASASFSNDPGMRRVMQYLSLSNALCDSLRDSNILARNYARMANASMVLGKAADAERYLIRAKAITDISHNLPVTSYVLSSFAILKAEQGDISGALKYSEEPLRIKKKLGQLRSLQNDYLNISEWQTDLKDYQNARLSIHKGIETSKKLGDIVYLQYFYQRLSNLDSLTGDYRSAFSNLRRSIFYKDSVQSMKQFRAVEEVREKYQAEEKEKLIAEKEIEIEKQRLVQVILVAGVVVIVSLFTLLLVVIRSRNRRRMQKQKDTQQRLQLETIVRTQEEVQQAIARDLHDGLVQVIGGAKVSLQAIDSDTSDQPVRKRIQQASRALDEAIKEAREISHQMLPYSLMKGGLVSAIDDLLSKSFEQYDFEPPAMPIAFSEEISIHIFRIVQELVNNVVKHADAKKVIVSMKSSQKNFVMTFSDDGKGFKNGQSGVGLTNIKTRIELLRGNILIKSEVGKGTTVTMTVPV